MSLQDPAYSSVSFAGAMANTTAIKTSIATAVSPQSYNGVALNGTVGTTTMRAARTITASLSASAGAYVNGSTITVTGLDPSGNAQVEVLSIVGTGGGVTVVGLKFFSQVTQLDLQAQANTAGAFTFGIQDAIMPAGVIGLRAGTAGNIHVGYSDNSTDVIPSVAVGEQIRVSVLKVFGDATTTATNISVLLGR